jgi:hypothetical protein
LVCGPAVAKGSGSGSGRNAGDAIIVAHAAAKGVAGSLCGGACEQNQNCHYVETSASVDKVDGPNTHGQYTATVTSTGKCECCG